MVNVVWPFSSVVWLAGDMDIRFFPDAPIVAVIVSPSTGQLPLPVTATVTLLLIFLLSVRTVGDTAIELASHAGVGVGISGGVIVAVAIGVIVGIGEGRAVGVAVGVLVGVTDVVIAGVGVGISVMVKLESWTLDDPS